MRWTRLHEIKHVIYTCVGISVLLYQLARRGFARSFFGVERHAAALPMTRLDRSILRTRSGESDLFSRIDISQYYFCVGHLRFFQKFRKADREVRSQFDDTWWPRAVTIECGVARIGHVSLYQILICFAEIRREICVVKHRDIDIKTKQFFAVITQVYL